MKERMTQMITTGNIILASVLVGLVVIYIVKMIGSARINKRFVLKLLQDIFPEKQFDAESITMNEMETFRFSTNIAEKTYTHVQAKTQDDELVELEIRCYNPEAEMEEEKYEASIKNARPKEDNINNPISGQGYAAGVEMAQNMLREQNKLEEEDRLIQAKIALHERDVKIVQHLNQHTTLFPTVYRYLTKKNVTCCAYTGKETLTAYILKADESQKQQYLENVVRALAQMHHYDQDVLGEFVDKKILDADSYKVALERSMDNMVDAGLVRRETVRVIANEYYPIAQYVSQNAERGLRLKNCSSYELYVNQDRVTLRDWDGFSFDLKALNLAELLNDPACELTSDMQDHLLDVYVKERLELEATLNPHSLVKSYDFAVTGFLVTQLNYIAVYISKTKDIDPDKAKASMLVNWDKPHMQLLLANFSGRLKRYEESRSFAQELQDLFTQVLTSL